MCTLYYNYPSSLLAIWGVLWTFVTVGGFLTLCYTSFIISSSTFVFPLYCLDLINCYIARWNKALIINTFIFFRCVIRGCVPKKILVYGASFGPELEVRFWFNNIGRWLKNLLCSWKTLFGCHFCSVWYLGYFSFQ